MPINTLERFLTFSIYTNPSLTRNFEESRAFVRNAPVYRSFVPKTNSTFLMYIFKNISSDDSFVFFITRLYNSAIILRIRRGRRKRLIYRFSFNRRLTVPPSPFICLFIASRRWRGLSLKSPFFLIISNGPRLTRVNYFRGRYYSPQYIYRDRSSVRSDSLEKLVGRYSMTPLEIQLAPLLEDRVESKVAISVAASSISVTKIEREKELDRSARLERNTIVFFSSLLLSSLLFSSPFFFFFFLYLIHKIHSVE